MEKSKDLGPVYSPEELSAEKARTSSNNMLIYKVRFIAMSEEAQAEVEKALEV